MQTPASQTDFYERKATRLQKDIAHLNQQLNSLRVRLRNAQDYQIKYELLHRQYQHDSMRHRKSEEQEKTQITHILNQQIERINNEWNSRLMQRQQEIRNEQKVEKDKLMSQISQLKQKNKQMIDKSEQMDLLLFKNKKIAKDLQSLQQIIQQNRAFNERKREQDLKICKQTLTKKYKDKIEQQRQNYAQQKQFLIQKYEKLEIKYMEIQLSTKQVKSSIFKPEYVTLQAKINEQMTKMNKWIEQRDQIIIELQNSKIEQQQRHLQQITQLKSYHRDLEQQIFNIQTNHQIQMLNFKKRLQQARIQELQQKQAQCKILDKQNLVNIQAENQKFIKHKVQLQHIRKLQQAEIVKLKQDKERLLKKIAGLKERLKQFETGQQAGQTHLLIRSWQNMDKKGEQASNYEQGVTFLQRQLKRSLIQMKKKNAQIGELTAKTGRVAAEFQKQIQDLKEKYTKQIKQKSEKIEELEQTIKQSNQLLRKKQRQIREQQAEYFKKINQINTENRSLINMNSDLQRDYNRILQSKKVIEKSFREERQRSVTSKSQIAIAKKNKWLELQKQRKDVEIIYKEKQEQFKANYQIQLSQARVSYDKLKKQKQLIEHELDTLKEKVRTNTPAEDKENSYSQYHKKLATVNLEIALTQNIYNSLLQIKSKSKKTAQIEKPVKVQQKPVTTQQKQLQEKVEVMKKIQTKVSEFKANLNKIEDKSYKSFQRSIKQIAQSESIQFRSQDLKDSMGSKKGSLMNIDSENEGNNSPTFNMLHSFNPKLNL